jgi:hypothetical protein
LGEVLFLEVRSLLLLLSAIASFTTTHNLGEVMFLGDAIALSLAECDRFLHQGWQLGLAAVIWGCDRSFFWLSAIAHFLHYDS